MEQHPSILNLKEIRPHGTQSFPCAIYRTHSTGKGVLVNHHWHEETEILYFSGGAFRLEINMESFPACSECFYFVNPGELHSIVTETSDHHWEDAVVFSPNVLSFDSYDAVQMHLIEPIRNGRLLFPRCLTPDHPAFVPIRNAFQDILCSFGQLNAQEVPDAETTVGNPCTDNGLVTDDLTSQLYIKSSLLYILAVLSQHGLFIPTEQNPDRRIESIKTVLTYMKNNYQQKIYISDLAKQVNLNEQYFCRLFKRAIGSSPMEYLNGYRIRQARRLLEETALPITEVCLECGFNNLGNFLREFRKFTETTPLQYRKQCTSVQISGNLL